MTKDHRVKRLRKLLGLTLEQIGEHSGVNVSTYCRFELGLKTTQHEKFKLIAELLNQKLEEKYPYEKPVIDGKEVTNVDLEWMYLGITKDESDKISEIEARHAAKVIELMTENQELRNFINKNYDRAKSEGY